MPARGKRSYRKKAVKKAKAKRRARNNQNKDVLYRSFVSECTLTPVQGVTVSNYMYWTQPMWNSANLMDVTQNKEFLLHALQYDRWRINSITVKVTPKANVLDQINAQNESLTLTGDGTIHTVIDRDGNAPPNVAPLLRYTSYKKYSILKPFSRTYSVKYPADTWLDCQKLQTNDNNFDLRNQIGLAGTITLYAENILEDWLEVLNEPYAVLSVRYNLAFQGKTQANLSVTVDDNGNPTQVTMKPFIFDVDKPVIVPQQMRGVINESLLVLDASGNGVDVPNPE